MTFNAHFYEARDIELEFEQAAEKGRKRYGVKLELSLDRLSGLLPEEFPEYGGRTHPLREFKLYGNSAGVRGVHAQLCEEIKSVRRRA